jgi:Uma2 family endonuclease
MTFEEAARLDPDEQPGELDAGRWVPVTKNTWEHGRLMVNISTLLKLYVKQRPEWSVASGDPGTKLGRGPDTLRGPDVGLVRSNRVPTGKGAAGWLEGAPDLVVEIAGDAQSTSQLMRKAAEYFRAGAQIVWVVEPETKNVIVLTPPDHVRVLTSNETLDGGTLLPGFACRVAEIFE